MTNHHYAISYKIQVLTWKKGSQPDITELNEICQHFSPSVFHLWDIGDTMHCWVVANRHLSDSELHKAYTTWQDAGGSQR